MATEFSSEQRKLYADTIDDILREADLEKISAKAIRKGMQEKLGDVDLITQKDAITRLIMERFDRRTSELESNTAEPPPPTTNGYQNGHTVDHSNKKRKTEEVKDESELSDAMSPPPPKKIKSKAKPEPDSDAALAAKLQAEFNQQAARSTRGASAPKKKNPVKKEKKPKKKSAAKIGSDIDSDVEGGASDDAKERKGGFHKLMTLSAPLSDLLGETVLSRPQTVKKIWQYVKERDLQDPADKRQIRCDDAMRAVFKSDRVHMFTMNKILATQLYPAEE